MIRHQLTAARVYLAVVVTSLIKSELMSMLLGHLTLPFQTKQQTRATWGRIRGRKPHTHTHKKRKGKSRNENNTEKNKEGKSSHRTPNVRVGRKSRGNTTLGIPFSETRTVDRRLEPFETPLRPQLRDQGLEGIPRNRHFLLSCFFCSTTRGCR